MMTKCAIPALALAAACLSGCSHFSVVNFEKHEASGVVGNRVALLLLSDGWSPSYEGEPIAAYVSANPDLQQAMQRHCRSGEVKAAIAPAAIPIVASMGKLAFDLFIDAQHKSAEELRKSAQASYSEKVALSANTLTSVACGLLVRYSEDRKTVGLAALVKLDNKNNRAFVARPLYIAANTAAAVTLKQAAPTINVSVAIATKGIARQESGAPGLVAVGEGVFSVKNIVLGSPKPYQCETEADCPKSDLIAYPEGDPVSIAFSIAETGKVGLDIEQDLAELKAIKEAMGPAIKEALKEKFK